MRAWVKGSIVVLVAALVCAGAAPVASAAEAPEETETVFLELTPRKDVQVYVEVHPQLGVAVVRTEIGRSKGGVSRSRTGSVDYAAWIPKGSLEGSLDVQIPGVASIVGELVPGAEGLEFSGSFHFTGNGGYLSFDAAHATGAMLAAAIPCREGCGSSDPGLFQFIFSGLRFSNFNTDILFSRLNSEGRVSQFQATRYLRSPLATFKAQTLEWLPGHVAAMRTIEVEKAAGAAFKVSSKAERPKSATVRPPAPFSGSAHYRSGGSIRSAVGGKLTGRLSADIFGIKVPLAGPRAKASLINFNPGY